ncbi:hypothetical protein IMSAG185_00838 [Lachnospiraceae bacterium]|nr:hypothetical protein IMSAG185_00838 [Lachnospiraceae bacterium]
MEEPVELPFDLSEIGVYFVRTQAFSCHLNRQGNRGNGSFELMGNIREIFCEIVSCCQSFFLCLIKRRYRFIYFILQF